MTSPLPADGPGGGTRLLVRVRYHRSRRWWVRAMVHGYEIADAVSARRMLDGIRARAERGGRLASTTAA